MTDTPKRKWWLLPLLLLVLIGGSWLAFRSMFPPFTPPVLPVPNGYDQLLQAAEMLAPRTGFFYEMSEEDLAAIVEQNGPALVLAREALQKECLVTLNWSADQAWFDMHIDRIGSMKGLARAFAAAARQAKNNHQMDEAVRCGLDAIELAQATAQGGLVIDRMKAGGVYYTAIYSLRDQVEQLSQDDCRRLQKKLRASPLQLGPLDEFLRRDTVFIRQIHGPLQSIMMSRGIRSQSQQTLATLQEFDLQYLALNRLLQTHLALRAYQLDKNHFPPTLDALVPEYLPEVMPDPFATGPLIYRPQDESYLLYSVDSNQIDDQGVETTGNKTGDLLLEPID